MARKSRCTRLTESQKDVLRTMASRGPLEGYWATSEEVSARAAKSLVKKGFIEESEDEGLSDEEKYFPGISSQKVWVLTNKGGMFIDECNIGPVGL